MARADACRRYPPISDFQSPNPPLDRAAADLDGTLLSSSTCFPYFVLLSFSAGGYFRTFLLVFNAPLILFLLKLVSESAAIKVLIFISVAGLRIDEVAKICESALLELYTENVRADSWGAFRSCSKRRVIVTANPTILVAPFAQKRLGAQKVLGTELKVTESGRLTGCVTGPGVLVGKMKREAVMREFGEGRPDIGLGDRESDHDFMELCKEAYMVPKFNKGDHRVNPADLPTKNSNPQHEIGHVMRDLPSVIRFVIRKTLEGR